MARPPSEVESGTAAGTPISGANLFRSVPVYSPKFHQVNTDGLATVIEGHVDSVVAAPPLPHGLLAVVALWLFQPWEPVGPLELLED